MTIGERIKEIRKTKGFTQQMFAEQIGCARNLVANYEIGNRNPSSSAINNICKTFDVNELWLRTGEGEMFKKRDGDTTLDRLCTEVNASDVEAEALRLYFQIDPKVRDAFVRQALLVVSKEYGVTIKGLEEPAAAAAAPSQPPAELTASERFQRLLQKGAMSMTAEEFAEFAELRDSMTEEQLREEEAKVESLSAYSSTSAMQDTDPESGDANSQSGGFEMVG